MGDRTETPPIWLAAPLGPGCLLRFCAAV